MRIRSVRSEPCVYCPQEDRRVTGQVDDDNENNASYEALTALRIFRLLRLMRLMCMIKGIRTVVATMTQSVRRRTLSLITQF